MQSDDAYYGEKEAARRRDLVVLEMTRTPPQPNGKAKRHSPKKRKSAGSDRKGRKPVAADKAT